MWPVGGTEPWVTALVASIVHAVGARVYMEIGSQNGVTVRRVLEENPDVFVVAVDKVKLPFEHDQVCFLQGDSHAVLPSIGIKPDVVFVDGGHDYDTALNDIRWAQGRGVKVILAHDVDAFAGVGRAVREASQNGWAAVKLPTKPFPWFRQTGLAILSRAEEVER